MQNTGRFSRGEKILPPANPETNGTVVESRGPPTTCSTMPKPAQKKGYDGPTGRESPTRPSQIREQETKPKKKTFKSQKSQSWAVRIAASGVMEKKKRPVRFSGEPRVKRGGNGKEKGNTTKGGRSRDQHGPRPPPDLEGN